MSYKLTKSLFIAGSLLFADWVLMILIGGIAGLCKAGDAFFCSTYCIFGISLLAATVLAIVVLSLGINRKPA